MVLLLVASHRVGPWSIKDCEEKLPHSEIDKMLYS